MPTVMEVAEDLWTGRVSTDDRHPFMAPLHALEPLDAGLAFVSSFSNVVAFDTLAGLVLVDVGSHVATDAIHDAVRRWSARPLHTAIYTHGHIDHVFGVARYDDEARGRGWSPPRVIAHEAVPARFDRYRLTAGYNAVVNARQFGVGKMVWPTNYRYPDVTYHTALSVEVGGMCLELRHARGETDDHTWVWIPERKVLCPGDLFIWASPNCGNPQKVQRYPIEWACALRTMAALGAELLLPGHGWPIRGAVRIHQALTDTAELLQSLHDQTIMLMNAGARLDEILNVVRAPGHLLARPYLRPVYDEPAFIVRNVWRLYGGWYDGNPAHLKPAPDSVLAAELATLVGGAGRLAGRALELAEQGELALACHLAELAAQAAPQDAAACAARRAVYARRAAVEGSTMARGIYRSAAEGNG